MAERTPTATQRHRFWRRTAPLAAVLGLAWAGGSFAQVTTGGAGPKASAAVNSARGSLAPSKKAEPEPLPVAVRPEPKKAEVKPEPKAEAKAEPKAVAKAAPPEEPRPAPETRAIDRTQYAEPFPAVPPLPVGPELSTVPEPPAPRPGGEGQQPSAPPVQSAIPPVTLPAFPAVPVSVIPPVVPGPATPSPFAMPPTAPTTQPVSLQPVPQPQPMPGETKEQPMPMPPPGGGGAQQLPQPKPFPDDRIRLPYLGGPLGTTPTPSDEELKKFRQFIDGVVDPTNTLDVIEGRARLLLFKDVPAQFQLVDPTVVSANQLNDPKQMSILGRKAGTTVLNLWFKDPADPKKEVILSYLVRVLPDPEAKARLERVYKALEAEINTHFPKSRVRLTLVGDKLMVTGQAHDVYDATEIMRVLRTNAPGGNQQRNPRPPINQVGTSAPNPFDPTNPTGTPGQDAYVLEGGDNVINNMRIVGEHQVLLRVTVAEVNRAAARSIGVNFAVINNQGIPVISNNTGNLLRSGGGNLLVNLDNGQVPLAIQALRTLNYARSLAEPNLTAMNGQPAFFLAGGQFPVPVLGGVGQVGGGLGGFGGGLQGVQFVPFGVQLTFTPYITDRDRIRLNMYATVSTRDNNAGANIGGANVPGLNARTFSTTVEMREGQTMAVAGLIQNNIGMQSDRVPFLGDLPYLGRLLSLDRTTAGEQELVVLVTPELVHPLNQNELLPLPGSDLYEPSDLEFYLRARLESRRSEDYRSPVRTDWERMLSYRRCEKLYISGPTGHVEGVFNRPLTAPTLGK
jgi:pilus assembly protein CpaC